MNDIQKIIDNLKAINEYEPYDKARKIYNLKDGAKLTNDAWENTWKALGAGLGMKSCNLYPIQRAFGDVRDRIVELLEEAQGEPRGDVVNGFKWPCFEDGTPIQKDDLFIASNGKPVALTTIKLTYGGSVGLNPCAWDEGCRLYLNLDEDEHVRRPKLDTQESIDDDARSNPLYYCEEHGLGYFREDDKDIACRLMVENLLRRQRELDARK